MAGIRPWKRGTAAQRSANLAVPEAGEVGVETDTGNMVVSDGSTAWASLKRLVRADEVTTAVQTYATALFNASTTQLMPAETGLAHARTDSAGRLAEGVRSDGSWFARRADLSTSTVLLPAGAIDTANLSTAVLAGLNASMAAETGRIAAFTDSAGRPYLTARVADRALEGVFDLSQSQIPLAGTLYPSGDTTGAADTLAINAALVARDATLAPGAWYLGPPGIKVPSNRVLALQGVGTITLVAGSNCNIISNYHMDSTVDTNITVRAEGRWVIDGNAANQVRQTTAWKNVGVLWVNVANVTISGITIKNTNIFAGLNEMAYNTWWLNCRVEQDRTLGVPNMDGIDWGPGCSYSGVRGLSGTTQDDVFSLFCKNTTSAQTIHPTVTAAVTAGTVVDTHHLYFSDVNVDAGINMFRMQAADGCSLHHIYAQGIVHTGTTRCRALITFGELVSAYYVTAPATDGSNLYEIHIQGFEGAVDSLIYSDSYTRNVRIHGVQLPDWGKILSSNAGDGGKSYRMSITGLHSGTSGAGTVLNLPAGWTADELAIQGYLRAVSKIGGSTGSGAVTNLDLDLRVSSFTSTPWASATPETGRARVYATTAPSSWGTGPTAPTSTQLYP